MRLAEPDLSSRQHRRVIVHWRHRGRAVFTTHLLVGGSEGRGEKPLCGEDIVNPLCSLAYEHRGVLVDNSLRAVLW